MNYVQKLLTNNPCYTANVNKIDSRYTRFQQNGPSGLMLHSVGCSQPDAMVFINQWNKASYDNACVHGFIDGNTGTVYQTLPWNYRGWHGGGSSNNTHVGVEMCESDAITYTSGGKFTIKDKSKAQASCRKTYEAAVDLFASLCERYGLNPLTAICSHAEGYRKGIATNHGDPEHYWSGLGMGYTMDGFRRDVKAIMDGGKITDAGDTPAPVPKVDTSVNPAPGMQVYKNGSTPEPVYQTTACDTQIGSLDTYEVCWCFGRANGCYLVAYKLDDSAHYKVGYVKYHGGTTF